MGAGWTGNDQRYDVSVQMGARPHAEVRISQKNTVSWTKSGFRNLQASRNPLPTQSVGVVQISEGKTRNNISLYQLEPKTIANIVHQKFHVDNVVIEFQPYLRRQAYELSLLYPYTGDIDDKEIRVEMYYAGNIWDIDAEEIEERLAVTYTSKEHKNHCLIQRIENGNGVSGTIFVKNNTDRQTISLQSNDKREPRFWDCKMLKLLYLKELKNWIENVDDICSKNALEIIPHYIDYNQLEQH